jgi:hypothetical protein
MSSNSSAFAISPSASIKNPEISRFAITTANVEETFTFPANTKYFRIQNEGVRFIRLAYSSGETADGGDYTQIAPFDSLSVSGIEQTSVTIYLRSPGTETLSIEIWK